LQPSIILNVIEFSQMRQKFAAFSPGLPDDLFSYQKSQFKYIWDGLGMESVVIFL
jgi:hypothetical protein